MSAASRTALEEWMREIDADKDYPEWADNRDQENRQEQEREHDSKSEK